MLTGQPAPGRTSAFLRLESCNNLISSFDPKLNLGESKPFLPVWSQVGSSLPVDVPGIGVLTPLKLFTPGVLSFIVSFPVVFPLTAAFDLTLCIETV